MNPVSKLLWATVFYMTISMVYAMDTSQEESLSMEFIDAESVPTLKIWPKDINAKSNAENKTVGTNVGPNGEDKADIKKTLGKTLDQIQESNSLSKEHTKQMRSLADDIKSQR